MKNTKKGQVKNCTNREYNMQHNKDVKHQDVKMYCTTQHFLEINCLQPNKKPHGVRGMVKHYHMRLDPKL